MRAIAKLLGKAVGLVMLAAAFALLLALGLGPHSGRYRTMTVLTNSMDPALPAGAVAVQTPMDVSQVAAGDVITYRIPVEDRRTVTHRVVEVVEAGTRPVVVTKGDAVSQPDPWVARLEGPVVWRTRLAVPKLGYVLQALQEPLVRRVLVLFVPLALALTWLIDIWRPARRRQPGPAPAPVRAASPALNGAGGASLARTLAVVVPVLVAAVWLDRPRSPAGRRPRLLPSAGS